LTSFSNGDEVAESAKTTAASLAAAPQESSRLRQQLRGDLDNIVLMALRKEPGRRYASSSNWRRIFADT